MSGRSLAQGIAGSGELVVIVDEDQDTLAFLREVLEEAGYRVATADSCSRALALIGVAAPDLVLLDVATNGQHGRAVSEHLQREPGLHHIPVVALTALTAVDDRVHALWMGADEVITKPVDRIDLLVRIRALVRMTHRHEAVDRSHQVLVALALALDARDPYTRKHSQDVAALAAHVARCLGLGDELARLMEQAGLLHDLGKVVVPDSILRKPGPLTSAEYAIMKMHPVLGHQICSPLPTLRHALDAIRHHHEWWDGRGYPDGLAGEAIPFTARILAIVDAYDAMTSNRSHRAAILPATALKELQRGAGTQWDPTLVAAFVPMMQPDAATQTPSPSTALSIAV